METEVNVINRAVFSQSEPLEAFKQHDEAPLIENSQKITEIKTYWYRYCCFLFLKLNSFHKQNYTTVYKDNIEKSIFS